VIVDFKQVARKFNDVSLSEITISQLVIVDFKQVARKFNDVSLSESQFYNL